MRPSTLLAVDDHQDNLFVLQQLVAQHLPECTVVSAGSAREGLVLAADRPFDGAIIDVQMAEMNGIEMCRRLKEDSRTAQIPVMLITAHLTTPLVRARGLEAGADDFISRPIDNAELIARIKVLLRTRHAEDDLRAMSARLGELVKERTAALEEQQRILATLMSNLPGMAYRCRNDPDWTMEFVSDGCLELTGYPPDDLMGGRKTVYGELIHPEDRAFVWEEIQAALARQAPYRLTYRILASDRREKWVWEQGRGIFNDEGQLQSLEGFTTDITDRKRAEDDKARLEWQLHQAQKMEAIGQLAGGVAHDFNNLLTVIMGSTALIRRSLSNNAAAQAALGAVENAAEQAAGVTSSLLTFSRKVPVERRPRDLAQIVQSACRLLKRTLPAIVDLRVDVPAGASPWVLADSTQLQQVILNLAINARDAMPNGGTVTIAIRSAEGVEIGDLPAAPGPHTRFVCLSVSDTGSGMPPEVLAHIFEPFYTTKPRGKGTGLGLAIIHGIIEQHGGWIRIESEVGRGSTFRVILPCIHAEASIQGEQAAPIPRSNGELVILAEDQPFIRELAASALRSLGYRVLEAADGDSLLKLCHTQWGDARLLVLDLDLPRRSGADCLRDLRAEGLKIPAIIATGSVEVDVERDFGDGTFILRKPFPTEQLCRRVAEVLAQWNVDNQSPSSPIQ